ncbi:MAG: aminopeptidase [Thermoplasmatota archaeon]
MTIQGELSSRLPAKLRRAAKVSVENVLGVEDGERILIVTNPEHDVFHISRALFEASVDVGARPVLVVQPTKTQLDFASEEVMGALRTDPDIILSISSEKLGKDPESIKEPIEKNGKKYDHYFNYLLGDKISRSFWSPSVTMDMFMRCVDIDYGILKGDCGRIKDILDRGESVHITSPSGTDIDIAIDGRSAKSDDGDFTEAGSGGNIPAGETFISPQLDKSFGKIVFDGSIASDRGIIIIKKPIKCHVSEGLVAEVTGGSEAKKLRETIKRARETTISFVNEGKLPESEKDIYLKNTRNLGELGIGLNRKARIIGNMLEDEKVYGTCHIAIGANYDQDANALIHLDGLINKPSITVSSSKFSEEIMVEGRLII